MVSIQRDIGEMISVQPTRSGPLGGYKLRTETEKYNVYALITKYIYIGQRIIIKESFPLIFKY